MATYDVSVTNGYPSENTQRALVELLGLGLRPNTFIKIGFPDVIEIPSSISPEVTEKIEAIMKSHALVKLQESEWTAWRGAESHGWSSGSWHELALAEHPVGDPWTQIWKYGSADIPLAGRLFGALARIPAAEHQLSLLRTEIFEAEMAAAATKRPTKDLRALGDDIDALKEMLHEKIETVAQRLALDEAKSSG